MYCSYSPSLRSVIAVSAVTSNWLNLFSDLKRQNFKKPSLEPVVIWLFSDDVETQCNSELWHLSTKIGFLAPRQTYNFPE
uniref:Uncharacterized protein n=1 Tax=Romanomermis culicivorax TaxID=13658 RepID=A0A915ILL6_ROMCU